MAAATYLKAKTQRNVSIPTAAYGPSKPGEYPHVGLTTKKHAGGLLRRSIFLRPRKDQLACDVGTKLVYGIHWEVTNRPYIRRTLAENFNMVRGILDGTVTRTIEQVREEAAEMREMHAAAKQRIKEKRAAKKEKGRTKKWVKKVRQKAKTRATREKKLGRKLTKREKVTAKKAEGRRAKGAARLEKRERAQKVRELKREKRLQQKEKQRERRGAKQAKEKAKKMRKFLNLRARKAAAKERRRAAEEDIE